MTHRLTFRSVRSCWQPLRTGALLPRSLCTLRELSGKQVWAFRQVTCPYGLSSDPRRRLEMVAFCSNKPILFLFSCAFFLENRSHYVILAGLECGYVGQAALALTEPSSTCLPSTRIKGVQHLPWPSRPPSLSPVFSVLLSFLLSMRPPGFPFFNRIFLSRGSE